MTTTKYQYNLPVTESSDAALFSNFTHKIWADTSSYLYDKIELFFRHQEKILAQKSINQTDIQNKYGSITLFIDDEEPITAFVNAPNGKAVPILHWIDLPREFLGEYREHISNKEDLENEQRLVEQALRRLLNNVFNLSEFKYIWPENLQHIYNKYLHSEVIYKSSFDPPTISMDRQLQLDLILKEEASNLQLIKERQLENLLLRSL